MNPNLEIMVEVNLPMGAKRLRAAVKVSEYVYRESFAPLPREREIPFALRAREQAEKQKQARRQVAALLSQQLAAKILELIEAEDPQHGYSPEEWRQINHLP